MCTGERQSSRIRAKYLRAILRQDVAYFDSESSSTAVVVNNVSADSLLVQEAMSEKVGRSEPPTFHFENRRKNLDRKKGDSGEDVIIALLFEDVEEFVAVNNIQWCCDVFWISYNLWV